MGRSLCDGPYRCAVPFRSQQESGRPGVDASTSESAPVRLVVALAVVAETDRTIKRSRGATRRRSHGGCGPLRACWKRCGAPEVSGVPRVGTRSSSPARYPSDLTDPPQWALID